MKDLANPRAAGAPFIIAVFFKKQRDPKFLGVCFTTEREAHDYVSEHEDDLEGEGVTRYKVLDMREAPPDIN